MIPQFDTSWYIGEIFWIFLSFGFMFLGIRYFIFPMLLDVFSERKQIIDENLNIAEVVNKKAEKLYNENLGEYKDHPYAQEKLKNLKQLIK